MNARSWISLGMALTATLATFSPALAKEAVSITISGPGLAGPVEVTDHSVFRAMEDIGGARVAETALPDLGDSFYEIRIGIGDETGQVFVTTVFHFYADPAGGRGYLQYFDIEGGEADGLGSWFRAPVAWEAAMVSVLAAHGVSLAAPGAETAPAAASPSPLVGVLLAAGTTVAISAIGWRRMRLAPGTAR